MKESFVIGQIVNVHGIHGEIKVYPLTDDINRFKKLKEVIIDDEIKIVKESKLSHNMCILKIEGIDSIEQANKYRNKYIRVRRENAVPLENENTYYVADIIDCDVYDIDKEYIGKIYDVINTKNNDVYWVKNEGKEDVLIPAMKKIIVKIDIKNSKIIIRPINEWQVLQ